jgi:hypothetical protein
MDGVPVYMVGLLHAAKPSTPRGRVDVVRSAIAGGAIFKPDLDEINREAQRVLRHFERALKQMVERLGDIPPTVRPREFEKILDDACELVGDMDRCITDARLETTWDTEELNDPPEEWMFDQYIPFDFNAEFDRFLEDLYMLSDLVRGEHIVNMILVRATATILGHAKLDTTALYTRVANTTIRAVSSPLDRLARLIEGRPQPEA